VYWIGAKYLRKVVLGLLDSCSTVHFCFSFSACVVIRVHTYFSFKDGECDREVVKGERSREEGCDHAPFLASGRETIQPRHPRVPDWGA